MRAEALRAVQAPLKQRYRDQPDAALITLRADGRVGDGVTCSVETGQALTRAGLHPGTGGDGLSACSGDMLLQALVACAGVTLNAVATSLGITLTDANVHAEHQPRPDCARPASIPTRTCMPCVNLEPNVRREGRRRL